MMNGAEFWESGEIEIAAAKIICPGITMPRRTLAATESIPKKYKYTSH
jgi:hypothetical protein